MWRASLVILTCVAVSGLASCSSETVDMTATASLGDRWRIEKATGDCNAKIEKMQWGSIVGTVNYKQTEPDHGFAKCMAAKLN
jgi:hypothetical protein